jgi:hypothetical protein
VGKNAQAVSKGGPALFSRQRLLLFAIEPKAAPTDAAIEARLVGKSPGTMIDGGGMS